MEESTATFLADYEDPSGYVRHLTFSFYQSDCSVGLFDNKNSKVFLKRIVPPEAISMGSLYPGATVTVCARPMKLVGFADDKTRRLYATTRGAALTAGAGAGAASGPRCFHRSVVRARNSAKSSVPLLSASYLLSTDVACEAVASTPNSRSAIRRSRVANAAVAAAPPARGTDSWPLQ